MEVMFSGTFAANFQSCVTSRIAMRYDKRMSEQNDFLYNTLCMYWRNVFCESNGREQSS